ncbi:MAG: hypothetical protein Q9160_009340, partial [Pyrenula sp. 1 TL-2023]
NRTAGSDTSITTICTVFYYLLRDPSLMQQLQHEIRSAHRSYDDIAANASISLEHLPLTRAVCPEAMRIYPPIPLGPPRVVPEGGDTVDGYFVPEGTTVSTNPFAASLSPLNFSLPWSFRPERWLGSSTNENNDEAGDGYGDGAGRATDILSASRPFSLGPRGCIGKN